MKKIYWFLQQLEYFGGTETATISLCNELIKYYDITLIVTARKIINPPYKIDKKIKIIYLNNEKISRVDEKIVKFCKDFHYFKAFLLSINSIIFSIFSKYKYRRYIKNITTNDDILITSSLDNYLIIPRCRKYLYHYHFNSKFYFSFNERFMSLFYHKPYKYIFLNKTIYNDITSKIKRIKNKSIYIENIIKLEPTYNINYYNNNLIFIGRYADQKDPLFLIKSLYELKKLNVNFKMNFYGEGKLLSKMKELIKELDLNKEIAINGESNDIKSILSDKDLLLLTSDYEGMPLVINEANSQSVPVFSTYFGDSTIDAILDNTGVIIYNKDPKEYALKLKELLLNKDKLMEYRKNSYLNSLKYSKENIVNKRLELLKNF